jgi:hypothetical protein
MPAIRVMYHRCVRRSAALVLLFLLLPGCEKPRERACRSLVVQAKNADDARTAATSDARIAANRARSAARWLRSNAVDDAELKSDAAALADALDRLADARIQIAEASDVLGASDATDLLARSERVSAYVAASDGVPSLRLKPCPHYDPQELIEDYRCLGWVMREYCPTFDEKLTLAQHATSCAAVVEKIGDRAEAPAAVAELASSLRAHAEWAKTLPERPAKVVVDRARAVPLTIADRGRADADVTRHVKSLEARCAP